MWGCAPVARGYDGITDITPMPGTKKGGKGGKGGGKKGY
jgi:hypothetical protein